MTATPQSEACDLAGQQAKTLARKLRAKAMSPERLFPRVALAWLPVPNQGGSWALRGPGAHARQPRPTSSHDSEASPTGTEALSDEATGDAGANQSSSRPHAIVSSPRAVP